MANNVAEERIELDDPSYPPELYHHVQDMINQLPTGHQELKDSGQFPVPRMFEFELASNQISLCPTLGENSPVYCPICPPPKIEIAFKTLKNRIYYDKRRSPPPLYKTEAAWAQHHWRRVHGNVVIPVPAPNSKVRQGSRGATKEDYRCPLHDTRNTLYDRLAVAAWRPSLDDRQLPLADEELRHYIYRVVDPSWATIYADLVLGHLPLCLIILWRNWLTSGAERIQILYAHSACSRKRTRFLDLASPRRCSELYRDSLRRD
ncbi:hypothetical protein BDZ89DRAFT_1186226 [Hymenopellis radicata]|nr:hypothetical protein BDZ89DRAFT_1186226 [Hymenopellis radicata]